MRWLHTSPLSLFDGLVGAVLVGTAVQLQQATLRSPSFDLLLLGAAALLAGAGLRLLRGAWPGARSAAGGSALVLSFAVMAFAGVDLRAGLYAAQALPEPLQGQDLWVEGVIASMPQRTEFGQRFEFVVRQARLGEQPVAVPQRVSLSWFAGPGGETTRPETLAPGDAAPDGMATGAGRVLVAGDRWQFMVRMRSPHGALNPHGQDTELWFWSHGIQATGSVRAGALPRPARLGRDPAFTLERWRQQVRDGVSRRVVDPARAGVLAALAVGDQQAIERAHWDLFRLTGVAHLMSISGLHVTMFAWGAVALVGALWRRSARLCLRCPAPVAASVIGVLCAALYASFSGGGLPSQRTVGMLALVLALRLTGRRWPWPRVWSLVAAFMGLLDPWALLQGGFWLSFVAVGMLFASDRRSFDAPDGTWGQRARGLLREQCTLTLALAPLTLWLFGQVSLVGLLANLLAIPWVTAVVTPLALGGALWPPLWDAGAWAVAALDAVLQVLARWPLAQWQAAAAPTWLAAPALFGALLLACPGPRAVRALGLPLMLPMALWQPPAVAPGQFEVLAADIGQGNAVLVRTAHHALLYDTGPRWSPDSDAGHRLLVPLLRALGVTLDEVIVSHRDADHIGGAASVLSAQPQARLRSSIEAGHPLAALRPPQLCLAGQRWQWDGVDFEILHPQEEDYDRPGQRPNGVSCVLRVQAPGAGLAAPRVAMLLTGDIEALQERQLLARREPDQLRAQVLLVPHHGSKTSSSTAFLDAVAPRVALIQAGWRTRFGHPAPEVLGRYEARGIEVLASPACGAARWRSQQPEQVRCERAESARYWHHRIMPGMPP